MSSNAWPGIQVKIALMHGPGVKLLPMRGHGICVKLVRMRGSGEPTGHVTLVSRGGRSAYEFR